MTFKLTTDVAGQIDVHPRRCKLVTSDNQTALTTAGYLNSGNLGINVVYPTDVFDVRYSYNAQTGVGTYGVFLPTITNGVITLSAYTP